METTSSIFNKLSHWLRHSVFIKLAAIGIIALLLFIPQGMIMDLISERRMLKQEAEREVYEKWGFEQRITGPILMIPYLLEKEREGKTGWEEHTAYFLPDELAATTKVKDQTRYRGIYPIQLFESDNQFSGRFLQPDFSRLTRTPDRILWEKARLIIGIEHLNGIQNEIQLNFGAQQLRLEPGTFSEVVPRGVSVPVTLEEGRTDYPFNFAVALRASQSIQFVPVGRSSVVELQSDWPDPSFDGDFLPAEREVSPEGFSARWQIHDLNRNFPQQWSDNAYQPGSSVASVSFLQPVDTHDKVYRATKYAMLIVFLTFLLYFFFEKINKYEIHPVQYLLVGMALTVFYLLLLSFSEHLGFNNAYGIATVATIGLLTMYTRWILQVQGPVLYMLLFLMLLYSFIFVTLQLEELALLVGSIGVFVALGAVMYASRKIDWYGEQTA